MRWVLAELSPYASPLPLHWSQGEEYDRHASYFGKPWGPHNVDRHLADLLGKQFARIFGREATLLDYQYVATIVAETRLNPETVPITMTRANAWLNERLAQLNSSSSKVAEELTPATPEVVEPTSQLPQTEVPSSSPWAPLLTGGLSLPAFYSFLEECGLLTAEGDLTPLGSGGGLGKASKAPWVGTLRALIEAKLLDSNIAAVCRALVAPAGKLRVELWDNTLLTPSKKSDGYKQVAEAILIARGLLR